VPPTSRVLPLPPLSTDPEIVVEWSGEDSTSGLAAYDVQVRVDGGAWQDWRVGVTGTSGVYVGILGHTYAFRSRGHDRAGNVEGWPAVPDAETRVVARVRKTYIFGGIPVAVRLLAQGETAGMLVYLHLDHLGSPVVATDGGGGVVAEVRYYPYGGMRVQIGEMPTTLNFTGQRLDAGVGLLYYRARYYDPMLGRFVQPDTIIPGPVDPQNLNRFTYVRNNPLRSTDPTGHWTFEEDPENSTPLVDPPYTTVVKRKRIAATRSGKSVPAKDFPIHESAPAVTGPYGAYGGDEENDYSAYYYTTKEGKNVPYCHPGLDIGVGEGTKLYATRDGIVVAAGDFGKGYGYGVIIWHPEEQAYTAYYHMQKDSLKVGLGDVVLAGDEIGSSGDTGSGAAHLHFEIIRKDALTVDREKGTFSYKEGYYTTSQKALQKTRVSPVEWFGSWLDNMEYLDKCPP
ncbi:MAG: RHS repeat-associated core domain-containing protein, partial [Candidatus Micrarchaeaceae archaeon]